VARNKQSYRDGLCQLLIDATGPDDTAKYTCRATTDAGTTDTSATLRVKGIVCYSSVFTINAMSNLKNLTILNYT